MPPGSCVGVDDALMRDTFIHFLVQHRVSTFEAFGDAVRVNDRNAHRLRKAACAIEQIIAPGDWQDRSRAIGRGRHSMAVPVDLGMCRKKRNELIGSNSRWRIYRNRGDGLGLTLPSSENTFGLMVASMPTLIRFADGALAPGGRIRLAIDVLTRSCKSLKILLAVLMLFAGAPGSALHAESHFSVDGFQSQSAVATIASANQTGSDDLSIPMDGLEHHFCGCPCIEAFPTRSCYETAYLEGAGVRYPAYLDALAHEFEPPPLRKPPRVNVSA